METKNHESIRKKTGGCLQTALIIISAALLTSVLTIWLAGIYLFPTQLTPVRLDAVENQILDTKIKALTGDTRQPKPLPTNTNPAKNTQGEMDAKGAMDAKGNLKPEKYSESTARREIRLTARELNGLLAKNTNLAKKLAIDLSDNLASAKLLIPLDPELPFLGGKTLKVTAGMALGYKDQRPVAILKGISIWGVPIPNAWLGGIKNIDLFRESGIDQGFWNSFAAGVDDIRITDGKLTIKFKP